MDFTAILENAFKSWKTSSAGLAVIIAGIVFFVVDDPEVRKWAMGVIGSAVAGGLILARDGDKTSEDTGAK
jgi:hypothetical protein